jgi:hypothetical protein
MGAKGRPAGKSCFLPCLAEGADIAEDADTANMFFWHPRPERVEEAAGRAHAERFARRWGLVARWRAR